MFTQILESLAAVGAKPKTIVMDAAYLKAQTPALSLEVEKGALGRLIERTKGGINTKLHAAADAPDCP
ncbi:hypothetical protein KZ813_06980 [Sphingomonas sp. RHCKR7]|nr:hypothetical protein [Sphingomonas folli]